MKQHKAHSLEFRYQAPLSQGATKGLNERLVQKKGISALLGKVKEKPIESALIASTILPLLAGEEEEVKPPFTEEDYKQAYEEQSQKLAGAFSPKKNCFTFKN